MVVPREDGYDITVASEIMAVLCLASDITDLKNRLARIVVGYTYGKPSEQKPVTAGDLNAQGAMAALSKGCLKTEPGTDSGACTCNRTRRPVCKYRTWMQLCNRNQDGSESGRLCHHRSWIRC